MSHRGSILLDNHGREGAGGFILTVSNSNIELPANQVNTPMGPAFFASHFSYPFLAIKGASSHTFNKKSEPLLGSWLICVELYEPSVLIHEKNEAEDDRICSELSFARYHRGIIYATISKIN